MNSDKTMATSGRANDAQCVDRRQDIARTSPFAGSAGQFTEDEILVLLQALRLLENAQKLISILPRHCPKAAGLDPLKIANMLTEELVRRNIAEEQNTEAHGRRSRTVQPLVGRSE